MSHRKEKTGKAEQEVADIMGGEILEFRADKYYNAGLADGMEEGLKKGREEGVKEGREEGLTQAALAILSLPGVPGLDHVFVPGHHGLPSLPNLPGPPRSSCPYLISLVLLVIRLEDKGMLP